MSHVVHRYGWMVVIGLSAAAHRLAAEDLQIFLLAGQSNMLGVGKVDHLPTVPVDLSLPQEDVLYHYWLHTTSGVYVPEDWIPLQHLRYTVQGTSYGPELAFGRTIADAILEDVAIIKVAANGVNLDKDWDPDASEGSMLYDVMLDEVETAISQLPHGQYTPVISGMIWVQGAGDAYPGRAPLYEVNLTKFVAQLRHDFGAPDLPFIFNQYHINAGRPAVETLRQGQVNFAAADPDAVMVNFDDLPLQRDNIHFEGVTQVELGERLANAYLFRERVVPGDIDGDGDVDFADFSILSGHFTGTITPPDTGDRTRNQGDFDGDGDVDFSDFSILAGEFTGTITAPTTPPSASPRFPEGGPAANVDGPVTNLILDEISSPGSGKNAVIAVDPLRVPVVTATGPTVGENFLHAYGDKPDWAGASEHLLSRDLGPTQTMIEVPEPMTASLIAMGSLAVWSRSRTRRPFTLPVCRAASSPSGRGSPCRRVA